MTDEPKPRSPRQIFDVSHPSKTKASATSKPVIVTNRAIMKDPMMADTALPTEEPTSNDSNLTGERTIQPISAPELPKEPVVEEKETDSPPEPEEEAKPEPVVTEEAKPEVADTPEEPIKSEEDETKNEESEVSKEPKEKPSKEESSDKEDKEAIREAPIDVDTLEAEKKAANDAELQKLVDSKKYFLSINSVESQKAKRFVVLGILLSLILAVAWVDIALDAGLIHLDNIKPLTHFFSN